MTGHRIVSLVSILIVSSAAGLQAQSNDLAWAVSQAPADALVVAGCRNIEGFWTNLKELSCQGDKMPDMLAAAEKALPASVDFKGAAVIILMPGQDHPDVVLMSRIKPGATLAGDKVEGAIVKTAVAAGSDTYVLRMDPWVAMSDNLASIKAISAATTRLKVTEAQKTALNSRTIWASVNTKALAAMAKAAIPKRPASDNAPGNGPDPAAIADWAVGLLNQISSLTVTADIKPDAAALTVGLEYAPDSQLALLAASGIPLAAAKAPLTTANSFLIAAWGRMDLAKAIGPMKTMIKPLFAAIVPASNAEARKAMDDMWAIYDEWAAALGNEFGFVMEPANVGEGMYRITETIAVKNPDTYRKLLAKTMPLSSTMTKAFAGMGSKGNPLLDMKVDFKPAAETIDGVVVDVSKTTMGLSSTDMAPGEKDAARKKMDAIYGPEGLTTRTAIIERTAVISMGGKEVMARAIKASKRQAPDIAANPKVAAALARVPKNSTLAGLVSLPTYAHFTLGTMMRMMTMAMGGQPAPNLPAPPALGDLVTFSLRMQGTTQCLDIQVPRSEIKDLTAVIEQMTGAVRGGGGPRPIPAPGQE